MPDLITFSAAICEDTPWPQALGVLHHMGQLSVQPNAVTCLGQHSNVQYHQGGHWGLWTRFLQPGKTQQMATALLPYVAVLCVTSHMSVAGLVASPQQC